MKNMAGCFFCVIGNSYYTKGTKVPMMRARAKM